MLKSIETSKTKSIIKIVEEKPQYKECLFARGYFITEDEAVDESGYPFYGQWQSAKIRQYTILIHSKQEYTLINTKDISVLLIGHAYNPFSGEYEENRILECVAEKYSQSQKLFFDYVNELTGIFCLFVFDRKIIAVQDCAGIKALYYGAPAGKACYTSHPQLVADIYDLKMDPFVEKLVKNRFFNIGNRYLPGDLSPFRELKRIGANVYLEYDEIGFRVHRFYPTEPLNFCRTEQEYKERLNRACQILHKNIELISKKWKNVAISLSGGTDSKTTLACANGLYDQFNYFSFQSKESEEIDAQAAREICEKIGLQHTIYTIPADNNEIDDYEELKAILIHNYGYVRGLSDSEIRKHISMYRWNYFDTEIKSWISEIVRVFFERKYGMQFPRQLRPRHFSIFQTRYFASPMLLHKSDKIYEDYMKKFDLMEAKFNYEHTDMYYWEVRMSSWGMMVTQSLDMCHRITFPFNNRKLIELLLTLPREARKKDLVHDELIRIANDKIANAEIHVLNNYFHSYRILLEKIYFKYRTVFKR